MSDDLRKDTTQAGDAAPRRAGFLTTFKAVLWSFFGVRRYDAYHRDAGSLDPKAVIAAALLAGLLFVLALVAFIHFVVGV